MAALYYKDEHTGEHYCGSGGSNVRAQRLLAPFGFGLRSRVYAGRYSIHGRQVEHAAGSAIAKAPAGSLVYEVPLYEISAEIRWQSQTGATSSGHLSQCEPRDGRRGWLPSA